jgi:hypothetical protein
VDISFRRFADHLPLALAATAALLSTVAVAGCSQESNYCDETACYACDGYGCRRLEPPTRSACRCDFECSAPGTECTSLGCTEMCDADADCPVSTRCRAGHCVTPSETVADASCTCTTTSECPGDGVICRDGTCVRGCQDASDCDANQTCVDGSCVPTVNPACGDTNPCADGLECVDGECRQPSDTCQFSSECGAGRVCVNQRCTTACGTDNPCPTGAQCVEGFCEEIQPTPGDCSTNADCGEGRVCRDTRCFDECATDGECGAGRYCLEGRCRLDDRPRPSCGATAMCASGSICLNGSCRIPCSSVDECQRFDVQYNFCLMNVCATTNEATSNCMSAEDCTSGQCVDGVCR